MMEQNNNKSFRLTEYAVYFVNSDDRVFSVSMERNGALNFSDSHMPIHIGYEYEARNIVKLLKILIPSYRIFITEFTIESTIPDIQKNGKVDARIIYDSFEEDVCET